MIFLKDKGNFNNIENFLNKAKKGEFYNQLDELGQLGVEALSAATPKRTGRTAASWFYKIDRGKGKVSISWGNSNYNRGEQIAVLIQYGHGTGRGKYVQGVDYINPAMRNVFQQIADKIWEEVINA